MKVSTLNLYVKTCKKIRVIPTWEGLKKFASGKGIDGIKK